MYNRQPCVTDDSYQLSHEHLRQLDCSVHFRPSTEVSPFKYVSGKHQVSDGEKECLGNGADVQPKPSLGTGDYHICTVSKDMEFRMRSDVFTASALDRALYSSLTSESSLGTAAVENGKRPLSYFCDEVVNKRARQEHQAAKLEHFNGNAFVSEEKLSYEAEWTGATAGVGANVKSFEAGYEIDHRITGLDHLEDIHFQFSDHSHWRHVSVGPDHQADLPKWTSPDSYDEASDKWLGTCVVPMPDRDDSIATEVRSCYSKICCDCTDEGSIKCVRKHVMDAREKLLRALGQEEFIQMGFSHMGEIVAQRWTEEEENLFHQVVLSNPESLGRNFWVMLRKAFPSTSFKELVSYYFNVFMLRKRAHQNRFDRSNADSDNDEWQESSDVEFPMSEEGEEEHDYVVESPSNVKTLSLNKDASEVECEERVITTEVDEGCDELKSKLMPSIQTIDTDSTDSSKDQDVQQILPYNTYFWWAV